jgi:hypothetical protein
MVAALLALTAPPASADRAFTPRFSVNDTGDIVMAANTLLSCQSGASGCTQARAGAPGAVLNDNGWDMQFVDVDSDPATFNSAEVRAGASPDAQQGDGRAHRGAGRLTGLHTSAPQPRPEDCPEHPAV